MRRLAPHTRLPMHTHTVPRHVIKLGLANNNKIILTLKTLYATVHFNTLQTLQTWLQQSRTEESVRGRERERVCVCIKEQLRSSRMLKYVSPQETVVSLPELCQSSFSLLKLSGSSQNRREAKLRPLPP